MSKTFRERVAWLGRMPRHYKLLFGSQILFGVFAVYMRVKTSQKREIELREEENAMRPAEPA
jgi:hypothetical protein